MPSADQVTETETMEAKELTEAADPTKEPIEAAENPVYQTDICSAHSEAFTSCDSTISVVRSSHQTYERAMTHLTGFLAQLAGGNRYCVTRCNLSTSNIAV
jgi:hypothetical protein